MNKWSDIQDLKKKKALLDEKYEKLEEIEVLEPDGSTHTLKIYKTINQPERKEDGDEKSIKSRDQAFQREAQRVKKGLPAKDI